MSYVNAERRMRLKLTQVVCMDQRKGEESHLV